MQSSSKKWLFIEFKLKFKSISAVIMQKVIIYRVQAEGISAFILPQSEIFSATNGRVVATFCMSEKKAKKIKSWWNNLKKLTKQKPMYSLRNIIISYYYHESFQFWNREKPTKLSFFCGWCSTPMVHHLAEQFNNIKNY